MKPPVISAAHAGAIRTLGFGRIELTLHRPAGEETDYLTDKADRRLLAAAAYGIAARLEEMAAAEGLEFTLSTSEANRGIITADFRNDAIEREIIDEILIEACGDTGFWPTDAMVEMGIIDPTGAVTTGEG